MSTPTNAPGATPLAFNRSSFASNPALDPLAILAQGQTWIGHNGLNLMVVPKPKNSGQTGFLVMLSELFETHIFEAVPAPVPNRSGAMGTAQVGAIKYSQTVAELESKNILHEETGMWMNQTLGTATGPSDFGLQAISGEPASSLVTQWPIVRSATIPHGNTIQATGIWKDQAINPAISGDIQPYLNIKNFQNNGTDLQFLPIYADGSDPADLQAEYKTQVLYALSLIQLENVSYEELVNPIMFLNQQANNISNITSMVVTTNQEQGAVINVPFGNAFAGPTAFNCTFLVETIANPQFNPATNPVVDQQQYNYQLQYLQNIPIKIPKAFNGKDVIFPHWNLNTLLAV